MKEINIDWVDEGKTLSEFCFKLLQIKTISYVKKTINKGNIKINNQKVNDNYILKLNDLLTFYINTPKNKDYNFKECKIKIDIFYEDKNIIIFDKKKNIYCQEDKNEKINTLSNYLKLYLFKKKEWDGTNFEEEPALIHRIDVNTEGLVISGKNKKNVRNLNDLFIKKLIQKKYIALVHGRLRYDDNKWKDYIYKHPITPNKMKVTASPNDYETSVIETNVKLISTYKTFSLVEIELITGKKHQIRSHLSFYKNPIVGDYKYANRKYDSDIKSQILISNEIKFNIDSKNPLSYLNKIKFKKYQPNKINIEELLEKHN